MDELMKMMRQDRRENEWTFLKDDVAGAMAFVKAYNEPVEEFKPGDLVTWKTPDMSNVKWPKQDEPAMVLEVFPEARDYAHAGNQHECSPVSIRCLVFKEEKEGWITFAFDAHRMTHYNSKK